MAWGNECADYKNLEIFVDSENSKYVEQKIISQILSTEKVLISLKLNFGEARQSYSWVPVS